MAATVALSTLWGWSMFLRRCAAVFAGLALIFVTGCMSMVRGTTEEVRLTSTPSGANVVVTKDGANVAQCDTPCVVVLKRKSPPFMVTFSKEGCQDVVLSLTRDHATGKGLAGNLLGAGGLVGMGVDAVSGAAYSIKPNPLAANLACD